MVCHSWAVNEDQRHHTGRSVGQLFSLLWTQARARCCSLDTGWLLILVLYPGCTAIENNRPIECADQPGSKG